MAGLKDQLHNPFLLSYLKYAENTESPDLFHIWSALTCISAAMQRHLYLEAGIGNVYGNMYTLLVGPPGTRKSSAIGFASDLLFSATDVRIAPDDTGGQRQGLISAIVESTEDLDALSNVDMADALALQEAFDDLVSKIDYMDRHTMFVKATEFGSFIGQNAVDFTRFLGRMWDGGSYTYQLKSGKSTLTDGLIILLGGTTSTEISELLPAALIGQGFMSRCILVYEPHKKKKTSLTSAQLDGQYVDYLTGVFKNIFHKMRGSMRFSSEAASLVDSLYFNEERIDDARFIFYMERRQTHLVKLAMCLAATKGQMVLEAEDIAEAEFLLSMTEKRMPEALGEYGLSPVAVARQKMLDYLRYAKEPVKERWLWTIMQRDMKLIDFKNALSALINTDKITPVDTKDGKFYLYKDSVAKHLEILSEDVISAMILRD